MAATKRLLRSTTGRSWYAAYIVARQNGRTPDDAAKDAALQMDEVQAGTKR